MKIAFKKFWHRGPQGWTSIDCQGGLFGVSVKKPQKPGEKFQVLKHASMPGAASEQTALMQLGRQLETSGFARVGVLARREYQIFLVDKAAVRPEEMESSLRWSLSPLLDYAASEANLAWIEIPSAYAVAMRTSQLYVIAAKRELVDKRMDLFQRAHLPLEVLDVQETSQRNISAAIEPKDMGLCLVFAQPSGVQVTVTYRGELYLERLIQESFFEGQEDVTAEKSSQKFDRVALEIQRSIDFLRRNFPTIPIEQVVVGPTQMDIGLSSELSSRLLERVSSLNLSDVFDWPHDSELVHPQVQALYFHALGAALRLKE